VAELNDHDMIQRMYEFQEEVSKPMFADLKGGKLGICREHEERLRAVESAVKTREGRRWGVIVALVAGGPSFIFMILKPAWEHVTRCLK
jgi:hypothetical protein